MNCKKIVFMALVFVVFGFFFNFGAPKAKAMTAEEITALIAQLQAQIVELQKQLSGIGGKEAVWCHNFNLNLKYGDEGDETEALQYVLVKEGLPVDEHSSNFPAVFGERTASGITGFQEKYKDEILTPLGLKYGTGFVGKATRAKLNQLYGCKTTLPTPLPTPNLPACIQVITPAKNSLTGECRNFSTPCEVPANWEKVDSCPAARPVPVTPIPVPECNGLWWYDNNHSYCQQGKFCGAFMYLGLRTFSTEAECKASLEGKSLTLVSPNGGEKWVVGNTYDIAWKSSGIEKVNINIFNTRNLFSGLGLGTIPASQGSFSWTIPSDFIDMRTTLENWQSGDSFQILILEEKSDRSFGIEDRSDYYFSIVNKSSENLAPIIDGLEGPTELGINQVGSWTIKVHDPEAGPLNFQVKWGDEGLGAGFEQKATPFKAAILNINFNHSYSQAGTYNVEFSVTDSQGLFTKTSLILKVAKITEIPKTTEIPVGIGVQKFEVLDSSRCPGCLVGSACPPCPPKSEYTIYNAKISVYDEKGNYIGTEDTSSGTALFKNLLFGKYTYTIGAEGFETYSNLPFTVCATCGDTATVSLKKISTPTKSITVLYPNGGEKWQKGSTQTIKWNSTNVSDVYIKLRKGNDTYPGVEGLVSNTIPNTGYFQWTIPATLPDGNDYAIRVINSATDVLDDSDSVFSIVATVSAGAKTCAELQSLQNYYFNNCSDAGYDNVCLNQFSAEYQGCTKNTRNDCTESNSNAAQNILCPLTPVTHSLTVLSPNGGETWEAGKTYIIKWTTTGYSSIAVVRIVLIDEGTDSSKPFTEYPLFNIYNTGSYTWSSSTSYQTRSTYKIKIIAPDEKFDASDAPFTIVAAAATGLKSTVLKNIENQLADISRAFSGLLEEVRNLLGR